MAGISEAVDDGHGQIVDIVRRGPPVNVTVPDSATDLSGSGTHSPPKTGLKTSATTTLDGPTTPRKAPPSSNKGRLRLSKTDGEWTGDGGREAADFSEAYWSIWQDLEERSFRRDGAVVPSAGGSPRPASMAAFQTLELSALMRCMGDFAEEEDLNRMVNALDPDRTGFFDFPKFLTIMAERAAAGHHRAQVPGCGGHNGRRAAKVKQADGGRRGADHGDGGGLQDHDLMAREILSAFREFDASNCGTIRCQDLEKILRELGCFGEQEIRCMMSDAQDPDNPGTIAYKGFVDSLLMSPKKR